jgi:oligopeptide transport system substrate-binding protein
MVVPGEPDIIDPQRADFAYSLAVIRQVFRGLLYYDGALNLIPDMAIEVPNTDNGGISADGLRYRFQLRDGLKWSDGTQLTAKDYVYALRRICSPDLVSLYRDFFDNIVGCDDYQNAKGTAEAPLTPTEAELSALRDAVGVRAPDDTTLIIRLRAPQPTFLQIMALAQAYPVRRAVVEAAPDTWTEPGTIVGSGPFILVSWNHQQDLAFERNPHWYGEPITLTRMEWRVLPDEGQAYNAYLSDEIDWSLIPIENVDLVRQDAELSQQNVTANELSVFALEFNNTQPPFDNAGVRKAFATSYDRQAYIQGVRRHVGAPAYGWIPPGMPGYNETVGTAFEVNPRKAKQLLADAGFPDGKDLPDVTLTIAESQVGRASAEFLKEQVRQNLGVDIEIEVLEAKTYEQRYNISDFQVVLGGWGADYPDPENFLPNLFGTGAGLNLFRYSNPKVDALFAEAAVELDNARRLELYDRAHRIIIEEDMGVAPMFFRGVNILVKPWVKGFTVTGLDALQGDFFYYRVQILEH